MNILILGGFLGSGKTSLLLPLANHIVAKYNPQDTPLAIIENEIGKVGIDDVTLKSGGLEVRGLFAGCVCCTLVAGLNDTITELKEKFDPEWVIIEATGLAYPYKIADALEGFLGVAPKIVVVVDAQRWEKLCIAVEPLMDGQVRNADVLLLNKCDLVDETVLEKAKSDLTAINPRAPLFALSAVDGVDPDIWEALLNAKSQV